MIFSFSAQPVTESVGLSRKVGQKISEWFVPGFRELSQSEQELHVERIDFGIRKTAHFLEYMVLGIWWALLVIPTKWRRTVKTWLCIGASALCAVADEIHQLFVEGRTSRWQDVCIDTAGAVAGILILTGIAGLIYKQKDKKQQNLDKK